MATNRPLLRRRRQFAAAVETTTGTAVSLTASNAQFLMYDGDLTPEIDMVERESQGSLSMLTPIPGARAARLTRTMHLHGSGGSGLPSWATTLLDAAGFTNSSGTFSLDSDNDTTLTVASYEDGRLFQLLGARATFTWAFRAHQPAESQWEMMGKLVEPTDVALLSPTYPTVVPPTFSSATLTVGGTAYKVSELVITLGNELVMREDANADDDATRTDDGTGYHACAIVNRSLRITMDPEAVAFSTKNWYQDLMDGDTAALSIVLGSAANNTITISAPAIALMSAAPGDRNGIMVDQLEFVPTRSSADDDEMTVAFS